MNHCVICNTDHNGAGKTCSKICKNKLISISGKGKTGGYREGSGRAKPGYYKGIYCGSTYELVWVIFQIDHNKSFSRFPTILAFDGVKYFPDFIQDGDIIEIKGYESKEKVARKTEVANKNGYDVIELRKDQLLHCFDWVKNNYTYKHVFELYDGYSPRFTYTCESCGVKFYKNKEITAIHTACPRTCSMKLNRQSSGRNRYTSRDIASVAIRHSPDKTGA